jgi:hypothetical protein
MGHLSAFRAFYSFNSIDEFQHAMAKKNMQISWLEIETMTGPDLD